MKTITKIICTITILFAVPLLATDINIEDSLCEFLLNENAIRSSGKGIFIHTIQKKAVDVNLLLKKKKFRDDNDKQKYLRFISIMGGVDFSLTQDKTTYTLEKLYFDCDNRRREFALLSSQEAERIRKEPDAINDFPLKIYTFDGDKTILQTMSNNPNGNIDYFVNITYDSIYFPEFYKFGYNTNDESQRLIEFIDLKTTTLKQSIVNNEVHINSGAGNGAVEMRWTLLPDKEMSLSHYILNMKDQFQREKISQDYVQNKRTGEWFPRKYIYNKYIYVEGEELLVSSETFEEIPDSVEFNIPIDPSVFSPKIPEGTYVIDDRYDPFLTYSIECPNVEAIESQEKTGVNDSKKRDYKIFIPESDDAVSQSKPYILDLGTRRLLTVFASQEDMPEKTYDSLMKLERGDIAWNGSLVTLRNAKVLTISQESRHPMIHISGKWENSYDLPPQSNLPYSLLVITNESINYLLTIHQIESSGIWITYKKLNLDEFEYYYQKNRL